MKGDSMIRTLLAVLLVCSSTLADAQPEPLRIGFLTVRTGPLAAGGRQMEEGINLFLKERNNTLAGRKVQIFFADTAGQPAQAKSKAQELVERDKVHVIVGPLATFEALAIDDYVLQTKVPPLPPLPPAANGAPPPALARGPERPRAAQEGALGTPPLGHPRAGNLPGGGFLGHQGRRKGP